jgi:DNA uptake protein ComE-like DNA-binding protein
MRDGQRWVHAWLVAITLVASALTLDAQVGKSQGVVDANTASEKDLAGMPNMTPAIAKALVGVRPFKSITDLNTFLVGQGLTQEQAMDFYKKAFVHVNLNTATRDEILLIPGAGQRMVREFAEYRPWKTWAQFDKEISKYVGADATAKLAQYVFIPVNLNTATDADILTIPGAGPRMVREFKEYRPWKSWAQFDKEIGKYVPKQEVDRLKRYVVIE